MKFKYSMHEMLNKPRLGHINFWVVQIPTAVLKSATILIVGHLFYPYIQKFAPVLIIGVAFLLSAMRILELLKAYAKFIKITKGKK